MTTHRILLPLAALALLALPAAATAADAHPHRRRAELKERYDTDKDGTLSETERAALRADLAKRILERHPEADTNKDGALSKDEIEAWRKAHRHHRGEGEGEGRKDGHGKRGEPKKEK